MKLTSGLAIASLATGILAAPISDAPSEGIIARAVAKKTRTDNLLFRTPLTIFYQYRNAANPSELDWTAETCGGTPYGYPFDRACQRHEFAYRNYKAQGRLTSANRKRIDDLYFEDMTTQCRSVNGGPHCEGIATSYYKIIRGFGGRTEMGGLFDLDAYDAARQSPHAVDDAGPANLEPAESDDEILDDILATDQEWYDYFQQAVADGIMEDPPVLGEEEVVPEGDGPEWIEGWLEEIA